MKAQVWKAAAGAVCGLALACGIAAAEPQKINIAFVVPDEDILGQAMHMMADYMERSLPGRFDVAVHGSSTLFTQSQQIPAMQRGNLDIGFVNVFDVSPNLPEASILTAGYLVRDVEHYCAILNSDFGRKLRADIEAKMNIVPLNQALIGSRTLVLRKKQDVTRPEDLANITMREVGNEAFQFLAEALGAKPTPIAFGELYLALQTGTVDAFAGFSTAMKSTKFYEVTEQLVETNHLLGVDLIATSKKFWDSLSDEEKQVVKEAADVASAFTITNRKRAEARAIAELTGELGMTVTTPDVAPFRARMKEKYLASKFAQAWPAGLYEQIEALPSDPGCTLK
ncbi:MAG: TRAP transporter substrate-binding protein DctP [Rhizobiaceae bacterium]